MIETWRATMDYDQVREYFLAKEGAFEDFPFGEDVAVFKVGGKMFGLLRGDNDILNINVKCNPSEALALRDLCHSIVPGYRLNKKHWNTIIVDGRLTEEMIKEQIDESYHLMLEQARSLKTLQHA